MSGSSTATRKRHSRLPMIAQAGPVSVWMILFVTIPMLFIIFISFMTRGTFGGVEYVPTLKSYETLADLVYFNVILKSLRVALVTTVVCLLLGYPFAYYIARKPADVASRLIMLLMIPFWTNSLMRLNAWMLLFQTNGPVNKALLALGLVQKPVTFVYTDGLVLLGLITNFLPFAVLPMYSSIEKLQTAMLEASADLGARPSVTFLRVTLPLTFPGIFSAIILTFIPALGTYTITDMLGGGRRLRTWRFCEMKQNANRKLKRQRRSRILGGIYAAIIYALFYIPVLVMIQFSFNDAKRNYSWEGFTTMWYGKLFSFRNHDLWESLVYSLVIAVVATIISVVIGVLGGIGLKKFEFHGKKFINLMLYVPIVVPEIVLAVSMLIIFMSLGIKLGMGTIVIGHCTFCIPYAVVTIKGRISGDNDTLQEASMDLGANRVQTFWRVTIPSIMPGILSAAFLSFTLSIDDVIMSNMLASARQSTLPVLILSVNRTGITPDINALTTIMVLIMVTGMLLLSMLQRRRAKKEAEEMAETEKRISAMRNG